MRDNVLDFWQNTILNIAIGTTTIVVVALFVACILLTQHTGPEVCNDCRTSCTRNGPTHFELLISGD